jgi:preprotein translocase SecE subunit
MAFGLYKPGQGYWMRVVTASMLGAIFLACAMWVSIEAKRVALSLPSSSSTLNLADIKGTPTPDTVVTHLARPTETTPRSVIGTAKIASFDPSSNQLTITSLDVTSKVATERETAFVTVEAPDGSRLFHAAASDLKSEAMIEPLYLQGIAASVLLIIGALVTYWVCAVKPKTVDFLIATDLEMKKVNWSTRREIIGSTWVVMAWIFIIAAFIFIIDFVFQQVFMGIGVLKS